jgi:hypothetical protein
MYYLGYNNLYYLRQNFFTIFFLILIKLSLVKLEKILQFSLSCINLKAAAT